MMAQNRRTDRSLQSFGAVTGWFVLALILLFASLSIALIGLGVRAYRSVVNTAEANAQRRASVSYVLSRIQSFDEYGALEIRSASIDGAETDMLVLRETIDGEVYETRLYCADETLREQFVPADIPLTDADDGDRIAGLSALEVEQDGALLTLRFTHMDGTCDVVHAAVHSAGEDTP